MRKRSARWSALAGGRRCSRAFVVGFDQDTVHLDVAASDFEARRRPIEECFDDATAVHPDHAAVRPAHAYVRDVGRTARKDTLIGGRHMGVSSHDGCDAPVEVPTHRDLFAGGFRVHIDKNKGDILWQFGKLAVGFAKRVVDRAS